MNRAEPTRLVAATLLIAVMLTAPWAWTRPLSFDERAYYLPAIEAFAKDPDPRDYPFPGPPLILAIQAGVLRLAPDRAFTVLVCRLLSTLVLVVWICALAARLRPGGRSAFLLLAAISSPFLLRNAYLLKHHLVGITLLCLGGVEWLRWFQVPAPRRWLLATGLITLAVLSTQFAAAGALTLVLLSLLALRDREVSRPGLRVIICLIPLLLLSLLFLAWGGPQPPAFRSANALEGEVGVAFRPGQVVNLLLGAGCWLAPFVLTSRRQVALLLACSPAGAALTHLSGVYAHAQFEVTLVGPVSSALAHLSLGYYPLRCLQAGVLVAAGVVTLLALARGSGPQRVVTVYAAIFACLLSTLPYLFESYCLFFVTPAAAMLALVEPRPEEGGLLQRAWLSVSALAGWAYTLAKVIEPPGA